MLCGNFILPDFCKPCLFFYPFFNLRNLFYLIRSKMKDMAAMLKAIHAKEDKAAAREKAKAVTQKLRDMKLKEAAKKVEDSIEETLI